MFYYEWSFANWNCIFSQKTISRPRVIFFLAGCYSYCHGYSFLFRCAKLPDGHDIPRLRWPITQKLSWFFTAHTHMTVLTPLLQGGMISMNRRTDATFNITMIVLILLSGPRGVFMKENGFNWMSACGMYFWRAFLRFTDGRVRVG
jgi:hypothetical protein